MKSIVLILFTLLCVCFGNRLMEFDFNHWKKLNVKLYDNKTMESEAYAYFVANKHAIDEHNFKYAKGEVSFARAVNKYADWSIELKRKWLNGFVLNTTVKQAYEDYLGLSKSHVAQVEARAELPDFVDWRKLGYVTPVQDQGTLINIMHCLLTYFNCFNFCYCYTIGYVCASCWTFSTLGALEGQLFKSTTRLKLLSVQNLLDCNKDNVLGNWGCKVRLHISHIFIFFKCFSYEYHK